MKLLSILDQIILLIIKFIGKSNFRNVLYNFSYNSRNIFSRKIDEEIQKFILSKQTQDTWLTYMEDVILIKNNNVNTGGELNI